jgi:hypothetical protein
VPGSDGKLSEEEHIRCVDWINERATSPTDACQVCGDPENGVSEYLWRVSSPPMGSQQRIIPLVLTSCYNCGFTRFFNASVIGLFPQVEQSEEEVTNGATT